MAMAPAPVAMVVIVVSVLSFISLPNPAFLHKIHRLSACAVAVAVLAPVSLVFVWHIQINRWLVHRHRWLCDEDGLWIDESGRRVVTNVNVAIHAGLVDAN
jgi:hypothetical protein